MTKLDGGSFYKLPDCYLEFSEPTKPKYFLYLTSNLAFTQTTKPNWFHRLMLRLVFGFKWTLIDDLHR